jgi:murein DD-endopeptidase MepM/ murein hydrolase activator NlpD
MQRPVEGRITSGFGYRNDPFLETRRLHRGQDIAATEGTGVRASSDGVVVFAGSRAGYGNTVVVRHEDGVETLYAHLRGVAVEVGERVGSGTIVGSVGQTGRATGPHLHFEVRRNGTAEDPQEWL